MLIYKSISSVLLFPVFWLILNSDYFALRLNNMLNRFVLFALNWFKFFNKFVVCIQTEISARWWSTLDLLASSDCHPSLDQDCSVISKYSVPFTTSWQINLSMPMWNMTKTNFPLGINKVYRIVDNILDIGMCHLQHQIARQHPSPTREHLNRLH